MIRAGMLYFTLTHIIVINLISVKNEKKSNGKKG